MTMTDLLSKVGRVLSQIKTPLTLAGLMVVGLIFVYNRMLDLNIYSTLTGEQTGAFLGQIASYLFWLALVAIVFGFAGFIATPILARRAARLKARVELVDASHDTTLKVIGSQRARQDVTTSTEHAITDVIASPNAIDFKFVNRGDASAVMYKFVLTVVKFELDVTPVINARAYFDASDASPIVPGSLESAFRRTVYEDPALRIWANNTGWGPASNCNYRLTGYVAEQLFPPEDLTFNGAVLPEGRIRAFSIDSSHMDMNRFQTLVARRQQLLTERTPDQLRAGLSGADKSLVAGSDFYFSHDVRQTDGPHWQNLPMSFRIEGTHEDANGLSHSVNVAVWDPTGCEALWVSRDRFIGERPSVFPSMMMSDRAYAVALEPQPNHKKSYSISRVIAPGEAERFHVVLSSKVSGAYSLTVEFFLDGGNTIRSAPIRIAFFSPHGYDPDPALKDGAQFEMRNGVLNLGGAPAPYDAGYYDDEPLD